MRYLTLTQALLLHERIIQSSGGAHGVRDLGSLEACLAQPRQSFADAELYPTLEEKAAALCFSLVSNHPFLDGNKRIGHAAMEVLLVLNGLEIAAEVDEQETLILRLASSDLSREELLVWVREHVKSVSSSG